jgi:nucleoside-diphosphate-sugar epimerase
MRIAITGAIGFLGRYLVRQLAEAGHQFRCWYRPDSDRGGFGPETSVTEPFLCQEKRFHTPCGCHLAALRPVRTSSRFTWPSRGPELP